MFRVKWAEDPGDTQAQEKLMAQVTKRLKADKLVLSHTDAEGFQCYIPGKEAKLPRERCVLCGHALKKGEAIS